jgi:hypothetical protein
MNGGSRNLEMLKSGAETSSIGAHVRGNGVLRLRAFYFERRGQQLY